MKDFYKVVSPGSGDYGRVFIEIEFKDGRLSITGVEGPKPNGDARGSCGQCRDFDTSGCLAEGWTAEMVSDLRSIWDEWHLNDMKAGCEHQRAAGWGKKELTLVTYTMTGPMCVESHNLKRHIDKKIAETGEIKLSKKQQAFLNLPYSQTVGDDQELVIDKNVIGYLMEREINGEIYKRERSEKKLSTWVREDEHPEGVLSKPCPECGYKYGSAWLKVDVPADILWWLRNLPDSPHSLPGAWAR